MQAQRSIDAGLERAKREAQRIANRDGKPIAILNLNRFSPLYVYRSVDPTIRQALSFVAIVEPNGEADAS